MYDNIINHYCLKYSNLEDQILFGCLCIDFTLDWLIPLFIYTDFFFITLFISKSFLPVLYCILNS